MKSIRRLSLALIMFSLVSISFLVTSVSAQNGTNGMTNPGQVPADISHCANLEATAARPACEAEANGQTPENLSANPSTPPTETPESGGITGLISKGLKALGIGTDDTPPVDERVAPGTPGMNPPMGNHSGAPAMNPPGMPQGDPCMEAPAGPDRVACYATQKPSGGNHSQGDPCMIVPAGPDRVACYATQTPSGGNHSQVDPCMVVPAGPDRVACYATQRP